MSALLWKSFLEDDFEQFQQLLDAVQSGGTSHRGGPVPGFASGSPGWPLGSTSPLLKGKGKPGSRPGPGKARQSPRPVTRAEINSKDVHGVTLLHMAASATSDGASRYARALISNPLLDLYTQDYESGWTALHRALYNGNVAIARELMERDILDFTSSGGTTHAGGLIKIKDHEGNSPFDVYALTVAPRLIPHGELQALLDAGPADDDEEDVRGGASGNATGDEDQNLASINGEELFMFGSNKNLTLGFGDEDDRHFPERITFKRPEDLLQRFRKNHWEKFSHTFANAGEKGIPAFVRFEPTRIQDVRLSKLHSAVLTTDPESNLYICGFGAGGRLGTGDQGTRFTFSSILGGGLQTRKIVAVGLGQDHTLAVSSMGELFSWGGNKYGQLGYSVAIPDQRDEDPIQLLPRLLFGPLKRETVIGCAASRVHSVVYTSTSLFTFGKNDGQLGLVDADARQLEKQIVPRKVAASLFSSGISMVTAIDRATACLLENHEVWIFANYGYRKVTFPLSSPDAFIRDSFSATNRQDGPNYIVKICGAGDTISALARAGEVFNVAVSQKWSDASGNTSSTTNPTKIQQGLSVPHRVWSPRKDDMAATDMDVGQDGSVILCTRSGVVWRRTNRAKIKEASSVLGAPEYKASDYKFSRVPGLTEICGVRSNAFGAFAAIRKDTDVLKKQIQVSTSALWEDAFPLLSFNGLQRYDKSDESPSSSSTTGGSEDGPELVPSAGRVRHAVLSSGDIESELSSFFARHGPSRSSDYDLKIGSTVSDIRIPCHQFILMGRSAPLRKALSAFKGAYFAEISEVLTVEYDKEGIASVIFQGLDILSLINIVFYLYTDNIISVWNLARRSARFGPRYRQVRVEVMKTAAQLELRGLEKAARLMTEPAKSLQHDLDVALAAPEFLASGDIEVELEDDTIRLHSAFVCQRCPFFEGLFHGRAGGGWLDSRRQDMDAEDDLIKVDLEHVDKATFLFVVRYLYGDVDEELFAGCAHTDIDDFLDVVLDVLAVANELMIDRLAQICQKVLGRYVTTRNICWLLNAVSPCSETEFKNAALECICLNLEGMLENRLLDELEPGLMLELGNAVRANQTACMPIGKSGYEEARLFEEYPELAERVEKDRKTKVDYMMLQSHLAEDEVRMAKLARVPFNRGGSSTHDLMFEMDEDTVDIGSREAGKNTSERAQRYSEGKDHGLTSPASSLPNDSEWRESRDKAISHSPGASSVFDSSLGMTTPPGPQSPSSAQPSTPSNRPKDGSSPWTTSALQTSKLDMKYIMEQASETKRSNISAAFASAGSPSTQIKSSPFAKVSQKERKRQLQAQKAATAGQPLQDTPIQPSPEQSRPSAWRVPSAGPVASLQEELSRSRDTKVREKRRTSSPSLTMRQTVPGNTTTSKKPSEVQATRPQRRTASLPAINQGQSQGQTPPSSPSQSSKPPSQPVLSTVKSSPLVPQSIRHIPRAGGPGESSFEPGGAHLPLAEILVQQKIQKQALREATAKRSLQEIQEEQAFQEWWDQEEAATRARMQEEESAAAVAVGGAAKAPGNRGRGRRRARGGDGGVEGKGRAADPDEAGSGSGGRPRRERGGGGADEAARSGRGPRGGQRRGLGRKTGVGRGEA